MTALELLQAGRAAIEDGDPTLMSALPMDDGRAVAVAALRDARRLLALEKAPLSREERLRIYATAIFYLKPRSFR